jgi:hypothetical protein
VEDAEAVTLAKYRRTGGGRPAFREVLEIESDGAFRLVRRVSADRAGTFAGILDATKHDELTAALDALRDPLDIDPSMPRTVLELVDWAGGSASFPLEEELPPEWEQARGVLQTLVEELKAFPVAALELRLDESGDTAIFEVVGSEPVNANLTGAQLALSLYAEDEDYLDSATVAVPSDVADTSPLPSGWRRELPLNHGLAFNPKRTLQLTVDFSIDGQDSQLLCTAGKGWF